MADIQTQYVEHTGYNEWAEASNMIVLYPQAKKSTNILTTYNPKGCWDWWGYTNSSYTLKVGYQMTFIKAMIDAISAGVFYI